MELEDQNFHLQLVMNRPVFSPNRLRRSNSTPSIFMPHRTINVQARDRCCTKKAIFLQGISILFGYLFLGVSVYVTCQMMARKNSKDNQIFSGPTTSFWAIMVDGYYFCVVTLTTVGYGDIVPKSRGAKKFAMVFIVVGVTVFDVLYLKMTNYFLLYVEILLVGLVKEYLHNELICWVIDMKLEKLREWIKFISSLFVVFCCIVYGASLIHILEKKNWNDSFYLSIISVFTIGYGDHAFSTTAGRFCAGIWLSISTHAVAKSFEHLIGIRANWWMKRKSMKVLNKMMDDAKLSTVVDANMGQNGYLSKSEFVIYMLKKMEILSEVDVNEVGERFDQLNINKCGISLASAIWTG